MFNTFVCLVSFFHCTIKKHVVLQLMNQKNYSYRPAFLKLRQKEKLQNSFGEIDFQAVGPKSPLVDSTSPMLMDISLSLLEQK